MALNSRVLDNTVGGALPGEGNTIAFNGGDGISTSFVHSRSPEGNIPASRINQGNAFLSNSIHSNFGIGIDLGGDGVTDNDTDDADVGANLLQNFPELTSFTSAGGSTIIEGTLNSKPNSTYRLEFFDNAAFDSSGFGEGQRFLGTTDVTTDASGDASFTATFAVSVVAGHVITATATDAGNSRQQHCWEHS